MKTSHMIGGAAVAAVLGYVLWMRFGQGAAQSAVRNDAAGPRLPGMPSMPTMPSMPGMPSMTSGAAPNMPGPPAGMFSGMWG